MFLRRIRVFNSLKSEMGLLSLVTLRVISITGEVWLVLLRDSMPKATRRFISLSMISLSSSLIGKGRTKNGVSSTTSILIWMFGHLPISSRKLKASL